MEEKDIISANAESVSNANKRNNVTKKRTVKKQTVNEKQEPNLENTVVKTETKRSSKKDKLLITFIGGVGEIGKNMTALEYNNQIVIIDAGLTFPGDDLPGVDIVIPDVSYLINNKDKVKAIILTHGHEDHIGAIPFLLQDINVPMYGSRLTLALVENKLKEFPKIKYKCIAVKPRNVLKIGNFVIEFIKVNHSIAGALALSITTPAGNLIHTGDFKIDFQPIDGSTTDLSRFGELGRKGVDLLLCESTNVCRKGYSMSESKVGVALEELFKQFTNSRMFIATFASNIHRLQQILDLAEKYKRKVAFTGRSMINVSEVAMKIGELSYNKQNIIDIDKINKYADNELLIITTGSQGEPMSALTRMAHGAFKGIEIGENDCIILSASPIPGNEKSVYNVINLLFKRGAEVIYDELADVHVSGHACQEEIKTIHTLVKPKCFMPVHGEYRHMKQHGSLAHELGVDNRNIILPELGMQVELSKGTIKKVGFVQAGQRLVDGLGMGDMDSDVLKDRKQLSEDGICIAVATISSTTGDLQGDPFIISRGVIYNDEQEKLVQEARAHLVESLKGEDLASLDTNIIRTNMRKSLASFIFKKTKRRPIVLGIVIIN